MPDEIRRVGDTRPEHADSRSGCRLYDANDGQGLTLFGELPYIVLVIAAVRPHAERLVPGVQIGVVHEPELTPHELIIGIGSAVGVL